MIWRHYYRVVIQCLKPIKQLLQLLAVLSSYLHISLSSKLSHFCRAWSKNIASARQDKNAWTRCIEWLILEVRCQVFTHKSDEQTSEEKSMAVLSEKRGPRKEIKEAIKICQRTLTAPSNHNKKIGRSWDARGGVRDVTSRTSSVARRMQLNYSSTRGNWWATVDAVRS